MAVTPADIAAPLAQHHWLREAVRRHPTVIAGSLILLLMCTIALLAPSLGTVDPLHVAPVKRLRFHSPDFRLAVACGTRRATESNRAIACSR